MKKVHLLLLLFVVFFINNCLSKSAINMTVVDNAIPETRNNNKLKHSSIMGSITSKDSSVDIILFKKALTDSLDKYSILNEKGSEKYRIDVIYLKESSPSWGTNTTVEVTIKYTVTQIKSGKIIFNETINTNHTSALFSKRYYDTLSKSATRERKANGGRVVGPKEREYYKQTAYGMNGVPLSAREASKRGVYAAEGAVRNNIVAFIKKLNFVLRKMKTKKKRRKRKKKKRKRT
ncbi:MAG: hypothetical protein IEMM0008_1575 [bacterium]|nr:MAG: hypothetical protein IEMM0008_1575 [bacterium]